MTKTRTTSAKEMFEEAKQHPDYWLEGFKLTLENALGEYMDENTLGYDGLARRLGWTRREVVMFMRGTAKLTEKRIGEVLCLLQANVQLKNED